MKHRFGSLTIEAIDSYVRVTVDNVGGIDAKPIIKCTRMECPSALQVAELVMELRGYWPDRAVLQGCGRAASDAQAEWDGRQLAF